MSIENIKNLIQDEFDYLYYDIDYDSALSNIEGIQDNDENYDCDDELNRYADIEIYHIALDVIKSYERLWKTDAKDAIRKVLKENNYKISKTEFIEFKNMFFNDIKCFYKYV